MVRRFMAEDKPCATIRREGDMMRRRVRDKTEENMSVLKLVGPWLLALVVWAPLAAAAGNAEAEIAGIEQIRAKAIVDGDVATLDRIYGDEWFYNNAGGESVPKAAYLERIRSGAVKVHSIALEAVEVRMYDDMAVVTGMQHVKATIKGEDRELHLRFLHVYANRGGEWKHVARQATNLPAAK
jgi:hypothetical protein